MKRSGSTWFIVAPLMAVAVWAGCHDLDRNLGRPDASPQAAAPDGAVAPPLDAAPVYWDLGGGGDLLGPDYLWPDTLPPDSSQPDQAPVINYGQTCSYTGSPALCADGKTICVPNIENKPTGFCTTTCKGMYAPCPALAGGALALCLLELQQTYYCAIVCEHQGQTYACPAGYVCKPFSMFTSICWPS